MISAVNSCNPVIQNKPIQFKGEQISPTEPVVDKEKSNATKLMIGATALAGIAALGIAGYKGKLGKAVQEFLGGTEKTIEKTAEKEVLESTKELKVKPSKYKDFTGVVETKNAKITFRNGRVVRSELKDGTVMCHIDDYNFWIVNAEGKRIYTRFKYTTDKGVTLVKEHIRPEHPRYKNLRSSEDSYEAITIETRFDKNKRILERTIQEGNPKLRELRKRRQEYLRNTQGNKQEG